MSLKEKFGSINVEVLNSEERLAVYELANRLAQYEMSKIGFSDPHDVREYLRNAYLGKEREIFGVIFLNSQNQLIGMDELFQGTINKSFVYPREVVKSALKYNAAACIFYHNHPSGDPEPSNPDKKLTDELIKALSLLDIRVLDHLVIGKLKITSFAENGLI